MLNSDPFRVEKYSSLFSDCSNFNNDDPDENEDWDSYFADLDLGYQPRETIAPAGNVDELDESDFDEEHHDFFKTEEDKAFIRNSIENVILFKGCDEEDLMEVIDHMHRIEVSSGTLVIKQGDEGDAFYVVKDGEFKCYVTEQNGSKVELCSYSTGGSFGELALIHNKPRAANVVSQTAGHLWVMNAIRYQWLKRQQAIRNHHRFRRMLDSIPLFTRLDNDSRSRLEDAISIETYEPDSYVCQYGDKGECMYFLVTGMVDVYLKEQNEELWLKSMDQNEFFGERSLITGEPRAATVKCREKCQIAILSKDSFERLISDDIIKEMKKFLEIYDREKKKMRSTILYQPQSNDEDEGYRGMILKPRRGEKLILSLHMAK